MLLLIDKIKQKLLRLYNPKIFLLKINNKVQNCRVLGKVNCNATNLIIGNNVTIYPNVTFWGDGEIRIGDNVDIGYNTIIFLQKMVVFTLVTMLQLQQIAISLIATMELRKTS